MLIKKTNEKDHTFSSNFRYQHANPYHDKMGEYPGLVLRDHEPEVYQGKWNSNVFERKDAPLHLEVGSGYGDFMMEFCAENPQVNFVGMDYRFKRSFQVVRRLSKFAEGSPNFRFLRAKGERISHIFGENEVDTLYLFFPDPWPKNRHHKKRLLQENFLKSAYTILRPGGYLFIKTDHDGYFEWMEAFIAAEEISKKFQVSFRSNNLWQTADDGHNPCYHFLTSFKTKFEKIFIEQEIKIKSIALKSLKSL
ncbi:MAG: tRNA (guanosine(46)-N7)-methyltransferase TrmB [Oligoflexia bacterium]|nr:tRNA (guanosine(46)-N7)-methyltransferase TrmB [Oligoflexia bacterium]